MSRSAALARRPAVVRAADVIVVGAASCMACHDAGAPAGVRPDTAALAPGTTLQAVGLADRWFVSVEGLTLVRPSVGADERQAYLAARTTLTAFDLATGRTTWRSTAISGDGDAVASDGRLVVHAASLVTALNALDGATTWQADAGASAGYAQPVISDSLVYVGTGGASGAVTRVIAYTRATGTPRWTTAVGSAWAFRSDVSGLAASGGLLYATATQCVTGTCGAAVSWVIALDAATGVERWRTRLGDGLGQVLVVAPPAVDAERLYVNDYTGNEMFAIDRATHRIVWTATFRPGYFGPRYPPPPVDAQGHVYVASGDGSVYALHARTGARAWQVTPGGSFAGLARCGARLVARRTGLVALDPSDGRVVATRLDTDQDIVESNVAVVGRVLVAATTHGLLALTCN